MADVISLDQKLRQSKERQAEIIRKRKILAVQKVFQCTHCAFKCEKCGTQIQAPQDQPTQGGAGKSYHIPYRFCESCTEEYIDYIERMQGRGDPDCYWHNDVWLTVWKTWIDYQSATDGYLKSKEFLQLLEEIKKGTSGD